ncbi:MAG TPA: DUF3820 family protein [Cellvibrionaceae bacterium]|nr:DUF3820 family protein [Cellvibrionaceae bacterium]
MAAGSEALLALVEATMPFGRYQGRRIMELPEEYLIWWSQKGFPAGELGGLMALALEIKRECLEGLIKPLRHC